MKRFFLGGARKPEWRLYFSYGMTKSGSTLAFTFARNLLEDAGFPQERLPDSVLGPRPKINFINRISDEALAEIVEIAETRGAPIAIKTHAPPGEGVKRLLREGKAIGQAIFRDPREIALSMVDHGVRNRRNGVPAFTEFETIDDTFDNIAKQIGNLQEWLKMPGVEPWRYDDFAWDHRGGLERMRAQMGVKADVGRVLRRLEPTKRTNFNKGVPERWRDDMSPEDSARFEARFAAFHDFLRHDWRTGPRPALPPGASLAPTAETETP